MAMIDSERRGYISTIEAQDIEINRMREKIIRAMACIEDEFYDKAEILLKESLGEINEMVF